MIRLDNISVSYNCQTNPLKVLNSVSVTFYENEWSFIIGGNGTGKSTLLKLINKDIFPDDGRVIFDGVLPEEILLVDQSISSNIIPSMTIYENLVFGFYRRNMVPNLNSYNSKKMRKEIVDVLSSFGLGLEKRLDDQVRFLSGGEQQIVVASRIMLSNPKCLLMDEFTSALDQKWGPFILQKIKNFAKDNNITVIAVTHDYSQIENIADRVILLREGVVSKDVYRTQNLLSKDYILSIFYNHE